MVRQCFNGVVLLLGVYGLHHDAVAQRVEAKPSVSTPVPLVPGIGKAPLVDGVTRLYGLQEIPPVPDQFGGSPAGEGRLWIGSDGHFCLVVEHILSEVLSGPQQEMAERGKLPWWPSPAARQMLTVDGQWHLDDSHSPSDLVLKGTLSWYPVFSPPKTGAALADPPCEVVAQYRQAMPPVVGPIRGVEEVLRLSPDPTRETKTDDKVEFLTVQTPLGRRRLPYVGFEL